jgi:hypothetical protein
LNASAKLVLERNIREGESDQVGIRVDARAFLGLFNQAD